MQNILGLEMGCQQNETALRVISGRRIALLAIGQASGSRYNDAKPRFLHTHQTAWQALRFRECEASRKVSAKVWAYRA